MIEINNLSQTETFNYAGQMLGPQSSYIASHLEVERLSQSDLLLSHLLIDPPLASLTFEGITYVGSSAISILMGNSTVKTSPFSEKSVNGKKLYRRKHGQSKTVTAGNSDTISIIVPYDNCKINMAEIMNCAVGDTVDFKVYDTPTGTLSTVPNYMLNQFGFNVEMPNGTYVDKSEYDADLIKDMKIEVTYKNNGNEDRAIGVNFTLHEVV